MNYEELKYLLLRGKIGMIPSYKGYVKYNYADDTVYFQNEDYVDKDIENKIKDRTDLYYII